MKRKLYYLGIACLVISTTGISAQERWNEIGVRQINEIFNKRYGFGLGIQGIHNWSKHSGLESGLYFKANPKVYYGSFGPTILIPYRYTENTIMIPLFYRFSSKLFNLTAGGTTAFILNYEFTNNRHLSETGRFEFAASVGISKSFSLGNKWIFEPELRWSSPIPDGGVGTALNLAIRKRIVRTK